MGLNERAVVFKCGEERLVGIVHGAGCAATGVLVIVGGPQYRVGSHRQFLSLARYLASHNVPVMRFDYRGMGDSEGDLRSFEDAGDDIRVAIDTFLRNSSGLESVILWGLCDAASAAVLYAHTDPRVKGMILLNPWVQTEAGQAEAYLRHYYIRRLFDKAFWQKVLHGKFELRNSLSSLLGFVNQSRSCQAQATSTGKDDGGMSGDVSLTECMYKGLKQFQGKVGIIISGDDLTAAEFQYMVKGSRAWRKLIHAKGVEYHILPKANHTFSKQVWRDEVAEYSLRWVLR